MKKLFALLALSLLVLFGGCLTDDDDDDDKKADVTSIDELTMGGCLFLFRDSGFAISQFGTFKGTELYSDASVYINGVKLNTYNGLYTKSQSLIDYPYSPGDMINIAVYALGDSVVHKLVIPETPVIVEPESEVTLSAADSLNVTLAFPGESEYSAINMGDYSNGWMLDANKTVSLTFPVGTFAEAGVTTLNAYNINSSATVPEEFDVAENQYEIFLVTSIASRQIMKTGAVSE